MTAAAIAGAATASAAAAFCFGFEHGAYRCQQGCGKNAQYDYVTHNGYLLGKLHMIYCKLILKLAIFRGVAFAQKQEQQTGQHGKGNNGEQAERLSFCLLPFVFPKGHCG